MTESKKPATNKVMNDQVAKVVLTAEVKTKGLEGGVVSANLVGDIRRDIVSGAKVQQVKNQIPKPKDSQ